MIRILFSTVFSLPKGDWYKFFHTFSKAKTSLQPVESLRSQPTHTSKSIGTVPNLGHGPESTVGTVPELAGEDGGGEPVEATHGQPEAVEPGEGAAGQG